MGLFEFTHQSPFQETARHFFVNSQSKLWAKYFISKPYHYLIVACQLGYQKFNDLSFIGVFI